MPIRRHMAMFILNVLQLLKLHLCAISPADSLLL